MKDDFEKRFKDAQHLFQSGDLEGAKQGCMKLLDQAPNSFEALHLAGAIAGAAKNYDVAESFLRAAINANNQIAEAHLNLARILFKVGRYNEAMQSLQSVFLLRPEWGEPYSLLGFVKSALQDGPGARQAMKKALELDPNNRTYALQLAQTETFYGQITESEETLLEALKDSPGDVSIYSNIAQVRKFKAGDSILGQMESLVKHGQLGDAEKVKMHFAIGTAHDKIGNVAEAFANFDKGNQLKKTMLKKATDTNFIQTDEIISAFPRAVFDGYALPTAAEWTPIFIVSMPRSGTSLTEQVLAAHPNVKAYGEVTYFHDSVSELSSRIDSFKYPRDIKNLTNEDLLSMREAYKKKLLRHGPLRKFSIDKNLGSFNYVGLIYLAFPNAKIINCRRDARAIGLSIYEHNFSDPSMAYSFDLEQIAERIKSYRKTMQYWRDVLPGFVYDLEYESLVSDFAGGVRKLLDACGLPWDAKCLDYATVDRAVMTASAQQVREPIYQTSKEKWRRYEKYLGPLLDLEER